VRGPTVVRQYHKDARSNAETWDAEGYLHTGDILYCDSKTKLWYIVDRKKVRIPLGLPAVTTNSTKELIKVRGFQVAPPEIEAVLLEAKDLIVDVAVIGLKPTPGSDAERPRAYVVRKPGTSISEKEVKKLIHDNLANYKQLTGGVVFLDEIPKSPTGKILKRVLREWADADGKEGRVKL
jgi:4-coumarate--CoA ligase